MLVYGSIYILSLLFDKADILFIHLQRNRIFNISADSAAHLSTQNLPCGRQIQLALPLPIGGRHDHRTHVDLRHLFFVTEQPTRIQKLLHIPADAIPLHSGSQYDAVRILQRLRKRWYGILALI